MKIGIISLQGAVPEHISMTSQALNSLGLKGEVVAVRHPKELTESSAAEKALQSQNFSKDSSYMILL